MLIFVCYKACKPKGMTAAIVECTYLRGKQ